MTARTLATRQPARIVADPSRVVTHLFVAGQEVVGGSESRASGVVGRILALEEAEVRARLAELVERFGPRHQEILATFSRHADRIGNRLDPRAELTEERRLLLGAAFTHEYAVEGSAVCNPSIVAAPDQTSAPEGALRFVMSVRGIGEGHRSSIGFRTGLLSAGGAVVLDDPGPFPTAATVRPGVFEHDVFHGRLRALGADGETAASVLDNLDERFTAEQLEHRLAILTTEDDTRRDAHATAARLRAIAACSYRAHFPEGSHLSERVLTPSMAAESNGLEDARFVRFVDDDATVTYYATYTAYDGSAVTQQLLQTQDFTEFSVSPMVGPAANNKGLALFPRRIDGRFAALSRHDRETNAIAFSDSLGDWGKAVTFQVPERGWEAVQLGNCGSPIETDAGWLVLTHGVGPMRTYSIGALLLDLDDPAKVVASLAEPLLSPRPDEQDGYVPNVVYSCGALLHDDTIVLPYGIADSRIGVATISCSDLLQAMA